MSYNFNSLKKWFGYNRKERRGTSVLLILTFSVLLVRYFYPEKQIDISEFDISGLPVAKSNQDKQEERISVLNKKVGFERKDKTYQTSRPRVELNSCDSVMLVALPGIGPVLSARIIRFRNLLGGYVSTEQLKEVYGLPPETYEMIKGRVTVDSSLVKKININTAGYREISRLPYFEKYEINAILKFRQINKKINSVGELVRNKILSQEKAKKVKPYLML